MEEQEVRFMVESVDGTYCVSGYKVHDGVLSLTEGDGMVHNILLDSIVKVTKETVQKQDLTSTLKEEILA